MSDDVIADALKLMPYGFYGITSRNGDDVNAMVANWLTQASFSPRLLALGLQKTSYTHGVIEEGKVFTVNIFRKGDERTLKGLTKSRDRKPDKMDSIEYSEAPETGCPILPEAAAYIECKVAKIVDIDGDHDLVVGEVIGASILKPGECSDTLTLPDIGWSYAG
jgi:flavin reductase (DIM6/NTAB) family NADH-FMN oxidoreductase RutF